MKRKPMTFTIALLLALSLCSCAANTPVTQQEVQKEADDNGAPSVREYDGATVVLLDGTKATADGTQVSEYDYTWHADPSAAHDDVKNAPAEYYLGSLPDDPGSIYIDSELYYFPALDVSSFRLVNYDGEREWAYYYTDGENDGYIFATLPALGQSVPTDMMHTEEEAAENRVLHITKAGTYVLSGSWNGQVRIDLGDEDEVFADSTQKVTLILNGADITCTVAPAIVFGSLYETDNGWEERETHSFFTGLSDCGANIIIADGSENTVSGCNIARMLKTKYKDEGSDEIVKVQKKQRKTDGALYSYVSMSISGEEKGDGILTVNSSYEGLDTELHLAVNSGNIVINSADDGINVNEDNVSTVVINGGSVVINPALGFEGDGIDSNGFAVLNGGTLTINGVTPPDSAIDTENGLLYNGGVLITDGASQELEIGKTYGEISSGGRMSDDFGFGGDRERFDERPDGGQLPPDKPDGFGENGGGAPDGFPGGFGRSDGQDFDFGAFREAVNALPDDATLDDVLRLIGMGRQP